MNRPAGLAGDMVIQQRRVRRPAVPLPVPLPSKRQVRKFVRGFGPAGDIGARRPLTGRPAVPGAPAARVAAAPMAAGVPARPSRLAMGMAAPARPAPAGPRMPSLPTHVPSRRELRRAARAPGFEKTTKQVWEFVQYPLIAIVALASAYSSTVGQWLILVYGIMAIWQRWSSRQSFGIALFLLVTIPLFQFIGQAGIAENVAVYVYELLVIGTILALIELHKSNKLHN